MDNSLDKGDTDASIGIRESPYNPSELRRNNCPADDKAAVVVIVAPESPRNDEERAHLVESLQEEGIEPVIIDNSKMGDAKQSLEDISLRMKHVENLIVVVVADGFYHNDGEAIIFGDGYTLLDTFIRPLIAFEEKNSKKRPYDNFILMSFQPRNYYTKVEKYRKFSTDIFKYCLANEAFFIIVDLHLLNASKLRPFSSEDSHVCRIEPNVRDKLCEWQKDFPGWLKDGDFVKWVFFLREEETEKYFAKRHHIENMSDEEKIWSHAKTNTMKLFFNDRDDKSRSLVLPENEEKLKIFMNFITQMSKEKQERMFDNFIKDLNFTHSLTSDIFNLCPIATARDGKIVTGCMMINYFASERPLINDDATGFSELFSNQESIIFAGEKNRKMAQEHQELLQQYDPENTIIYGYQQVTDKDYSDFKKKMKKKISDTLYESNISALVLYISSHGGFTKGGQYMCLSGKNQRKTITSLLKDIFGGVDKSIPKIIFVDTCHGDARNHLDVFSRKKSKVGTHPSNAKGKSPAAAGVGQKMGKKATENLDNFIIIHASVQQNYSWQEVKNSSGSEFLKVLRDTIESYPKNDNSLDIMRLSFDLVNRIEKVTDFAGDEGRVKLMCETDVCLNKNFSIRMKEGKIDSDAN